MILRIPSTVLLYLLQEKKIISKERQGMYNYKTDNYRCFKGFFDGRNWEKLMDDENLDM